MNEAARVACLLHFNVASKKAQQQTCKGRINVFPLSIYVYIYTAHLSYAESLQNTAAAIDFFVNRVSYQLSKLSDKKYFCLINEIAYWFTL